MAHQDPFKMGYCPLELLDVLRDYYGEAVNDSVSGKKSIPSLKSITHPL